MMTKIEPVILFGQWVNLEPLTEEHRQPLQNIAQDARIWTHTASKAMGEKFQHWFDKALQEQQTGQQLPFAVRQLSDQKIIGTTRLYDIHSEHKRLTIGYTWYIPEVWGTEVNPECKYLLLKYVFEDLNVNRVEFYVDTRNSRSRSAIKKLGAQEEGILRKHMILEDGYVRDSVIASIIQSDWIFVQEKLIERLKTFEK